MLPERLSFRPETQQDPETGLTVRRLTDSLAHQAHFHLLYFNMYYYGPQGKWLVFGASRRGASGFYLMEIPDDAAELEARLLLAGEDLPLLRSSLSPDGRFLYFHRGRSLWRLATSGGEPEELYRLPGEDEQVFLISVSSDGEKVACSVGPRVKIERPRPGTYGTFHERFEKIKWSRIDEVEVRTRRHWTATRQEFWISHLLYRPGRPDTILFCREGPWRQVDQRMWLLEGGRLRKVRPQGPGDALGHEFWYPDGSRVGYHGRVPDGEGNEVEVVGIWWAEEDRWREWKAHQRPGGLFHTQVSADLSYFISDGNTQEPYIMRIDMPEDAAEARMSNLCRHDGTWDQTQAHQPHPTAHPSGRSILFNSNRRDMHCDIYQVFL